RERNLLFRELRLLHGELPPSRAVSPVFSSSGVSNISGGGQHRLDTTLSGAFHLASGLCWDGQQKAHVMR
ncbi:hypothetical protein, partial [Ralstonia pseudosolanacearum]|uniref:hypothetical protein n=1 Tax=Ralstonia pseudosolanacearum TaxID=1310165 RepID=UPI001E405845